MKITIYELLGMVKDGKAPKKIIFEDQELTYYEPGRDYRVYQEGFLFTNLFAENYDVLNDEVEILEEEKKIPEKIGVINYIEDQATALVHRKVDEIIDYLNYLKSKGDK